MLQGYITSFVKTGDPGFEAYGEGNVRELVPRGTGGEYVRDPTENERCDWWQRAVYEERE